MAFFSFLFFPLYAAFANLTLTVCLSSQILPTQLSYPPFLHAKRSQGNPWLLLYSLPPQRKS